MQQNILKKKNKNKSHPQQQQQQVQNHVFKSLKKTDNDVKASINEELLSLIKNSYQEKRTQFLDFLSKVDKDIKENVATSQNTKEDEDSHRLIVLQNIKNMIQEGDKMYAIKKECTPFKTMILNFEDEENFQQIYRKKRVCLDSKIRDDPFEYIEYLFEQLEHKEILNKLLKNGSIIQEFKWEKRESKLRDFYLKQIQSEYPEYADTLAFYHLRIFIPIHFLTIYASLK